MNEREELEAMCSRFFDGDLSADERGRLQRSLQEDAELDELFADLERSHRGMEMVRTHWALPRDFTSQIMAGIEDGQPDRAPAEQPEGRILRFSSTRWWAAAAAAVLFCGGIVVGAAWMAENGRDEGAGAGGSSVATVSDGGNDAGDGLEKPRPQARATVEAYSSGTLEIVDADGRRASGVDLVEEVSLPAEVRAPKGSHAVVKLGRGTVVLAPGAAARLLDVDADGGPEMEPVDGDLYVESAGDAPVRTRLRPDLTMNVRDAGVTLSRGEGGYVARPSFGQVQLSGSSQTTSLGWLQRALVSEDGSVSLESCDGSDLEGWATAGRVDELKRQLRIALGEEEFARIPPEQWQEWDDMILGLASRPVERATHAYVLHWLLEHGWFEDSTDEVRGAFERIADLLAEGTSDDDVLEFVRINLRRLERVLRREPGLLQQFKQGWREEWERRGEKLRQINPAGD